MDWNKKKNSFFKSNSFFNEIINYEWVNTSIVEIYQKKTILIIYIAILITKRKHMYIYVIKLYYLLLGTHNIDFIQ